MYRKYTPEKQRIRGKMEGVNMQLVHIPRGQSRSRLQTESCHKSLHFPSHSWQRGKHGAIASRIQQEAKSLVIGLSGDTVRPQFVDHCCELCTMSTGRRTVDVRQKVPKQGSTCTALKQCVMHMSPHTLHVTEPLGIQPYVCHSTLRARIAPCQVTPGLRHHIWQAARPQGSHWPDGR
jgi:hypothetical protein